MEIDSGAQGFDNQELEERSIAANRYGQENPDTYVDYAHDQIVLAERSTQESRFMWEELLKGYRGKVDYGYKQDWQSKVTTGDLNSTVKQATAIIRKAFRQPDWYNIEGVSDEDKVDASFLEQAFGVFLDAQHAQFNTLFCDACELGFAIGQTHDIIPQWIDGFGLALTLVPPWQIYRDPDALPRKPWSGDWWGHVEWLDLWKVKQWGKNPNYVRLDEVTANESAWGVENQEKRARRKGQYYQRNSSRHAVRVVEFWGTVLDKAGELLLNDARFTIAGDVLIRNPEPNPFVGIRWPGVSFSPIPDLFSFEGHGIIETSLTLWRMTCNLMSLHVDDLSWRVNKMRELNRMDLEDPTDVKFSPGKVVLRSKNAPPGQPVVREVYTNQSTNETLATLQHWDQRRENSSMVNQFVAGQRGTRTQITKGEVEIKTAQSMTVFDPMGHDVEEGAVNVLKAIREVLVLSWSEYSNPSVSRIFPNNLLAKAFASMPIEAKREMLKANCDIKISGISAELKNSELIPRLQWFMGQASNEAFGKYIKPYELLKRATTTLGFHDPDFIATDEEAKAVDVYWQQIAQIVQQLESMKGGGAPEIGGRAPGGGNGPAVGSLQQLTSGVPGSLPSEGGRIQ